MVENPFKSFPPPAEEAASQPPEAREKREGFRHGKFQFKGKREEQQDIFGTKNIETAKGRALLAVIADGHEHDKTSIATPALATSALLSSMESALASGDVSDEEALIAAFKDAQDAILDVSHEGGTTATCVLFRGKEATIGWVGNTEARVFSLSEKSRILTTPHQFGRHPGETKRLTDARAQVWHHADKSINTLSPTDADPPTDGYVFYNGHALEISRSLGDEEMAPMVSSKPEVTHVTFDEDDRFLVIASDGLWERVYKLPRRRMDIEKLLREVKDANEATRKLEAMLHAWMLEDNTTVVVIEIPKSE